MRKLLLTTLLVAFCSWLCIAGTKVITLSGMVVTGINPKTGNEVGRGDPLGGVEVEVEGTEFKTVSSANGYFSFEDLPDGEYRLICKKPGFPTVTQRVRVNYVGMSSRCQVLMNPENAGFVDGMAVKSGDLYVAFSKKPANVNNMESSPNKMIWQQAMAAGADLGQLWNKDENLPKTPRGPGEAFLMNPITGFDNCLMVYPPNNPSKSGFVQMQTKPYWLTFDRGGNFLYVAGEANVVQVFDARRDNALLRNLPTNGAVTDLKLSPDGRYVLACIMGGKPGVMLIDTTSNVPAGFLPTDTSPWSACIAGPRVFACLGDARRGEVVAIDAATGTTVGRCKVGNCPTSIAVTPDFTKAYVACSGNACVSLLDTASVTEVTRIPVQVEPQKLAISPDGQRCMVTNKVSGTVSVIDTAAGGVIDTITVGKAPIGICYGRDGHKAYVACRDSRVIMTLDGKSGQLIHTTLPMPNSIPLGVAVRP
ncbi:carboxypeptidase regulatory-like domain-containing protein [bacterium]|nr:carboxypeptidase regulatory-like domain-containing protein [bacterium]